MRVSGSSVFRRFAVLLIVLIAPVALLSGCGSSTKSAAASSSPAAASDAATSGDASDNEAVSTDCPTENTKSFAKTKFVAHAGLGFGAFHRYLYKPFKAGTFNKGADGRVGAFVKGGVAALFIKREVRLASEDVKANPTLCKSIAAPLAKIGNSVQDAVNKAKSGDTSGLEQINQSIGTVSALSGKDGVDIKEDDNPDITSKPK